MKYIQFENNVFEDFTNILEKDDRTSKKLMESIKIISDSFFNNENLKLSIDNSKTYKKKFSDNDELVYQISDNILKIISCRGTMMINEK